MTSEVFPYTKTGLSMPLPRQTIRYTYTHTNTMGKVALGLVLVCLLSLGCLTCSAELAASEVSALKAIAAKLKIGSDLWNFNLDPCTQWRKEVGKVAADITNELNCTCNETTNICHVEKIRLKSANLQGELPDEEFANLTHLTFLDLVRDYINGSLPTTWTKLPLEHIGLNGNRLRGKIPKEIGEINTLKSIVWEGNLLWGRIPDSIGNLKNLEEIQLSANNIMGELPPSLGKLTSMRDFRIDGTGISGKFPSFIGNWTLLKRLLLRGTSLEGAFPSTLSALTELTELRVTDFKGDGKFPLIENMSSLKYLILRNCSISSPIPEFLGQFSQLEILDLSFNYLTGTIPTTFRTLVGVEKPKRIQYMYLANNMLNGTIPDWLFGKDNIDLSYNFFTGPDKNSCQLGSMNLVSSLQSSRSNATTFCLRKNLPCTTIARDYELFIDCGGPGRDWNGSKYEKDDNPSGTSTFFLSPSRKWAYSSTGAFSGNSGAAYIVTNASVLKTTNPLYLKARASASSLRYYGLCLQSGNYTVKLHFAELTFTDDQTYASLGRRFFDVAIQGKKVLKDFNIAARASGTGREIVMPFNVSVRNTLEIHFRWRGKGTNAIPEKGNYGPLISAISVTPNFKPQVDFNDIEDSGLSRRAIVGIIIGCLLAISLIIVISWILSCKKKRKNEELKQLKSQGTYFNLRQIKAATKNFDLENKIGEGGFGPVYKGVLPDGSMVAVKKLSSKSKQGNREFVNEIGIISGLQHPNLVKLFGCCIEGSQLLLIYEYLENNSLARALFGPAEARLKLDWQRRCQISLDIARGLAYLHEESRLKIVHRDIKATNILLDKDLNAKISDFGLAKLDDEENTHISTRIAGTKGYMAPEYAMRGHLTEKADVYSYGVVLLEIISGNSNTNYRTEDDFVYLLDWACILKDQGQLLDLVDPSLSSNYSMIEAERMLNLALMCTNPSLTLRPAMTSVVTMIEGGTMVTTPSMTSPKNMSAETSFKAFKQLSNGSKEISSDGPWMESSMDFGGNEDAISTSMAAQLMGERSI